MKYAFIRSNAANYPVIHLCRLLGVQRRLLRLAQPTSEDNWS